MKKLVIGKKLEQFLRKNRCLMAFRQSRIKGMKTESSNQIEHTNGEIASSACNAIPGAFYWGDAVVPKHAKVLNPFTYWSQIYEKWRQL